MYLPILGIKCYFYKSTTKMNVYNSGSKTMFYNLLYMYISLNVNKYQ